jgi:hypothetical protein
MALSDDAERRRYRRHDMEGRELALQRWDSVRGTGESIGQIIDLSAGGLRFRTKKNTFHVDSHIRVRLDLPAYAGITPFFNSEEGRTDWAGWLVVTRVQRTVEGGYEVAGRLVDMDEMNRGSLKLYLSTQPLAA